MLFLHKITIFCFAASYSVALALELLDVLLSRPFLRVVSLVFGAAGLLAHMLYIGVNPLSLADPRGSLFFLALVLAVFYVYGSIHHKGITWGLFVLPVVLGLVILGIVFSSPEDHSSAGALTGLLGFWGIVHVVLLLAAAVGICVGAVASIMYLVQVRRLRTKMAPGEGMKMLSLERIEAMNRRAVLLAFPFLTTGVLVGLALMAERGDFFEKWDPKILGVLGLWTVFAVLLYLRYSVHVRGRQAAWWTLFAFVILVLALVAPGHSFLPGDEP
jgi:ABC-type transport system involved in cytochrome c biogenesis permease subunit